MVLILPGWLVTDDEHVEGEVEFCDLLVDLGVVGFDVDAVGAPVLAVFVLVAGEEHDAFLFLGDEGLKDLLGLGERDGVDVARGGLVLEVFTDLLQFFHRDFLF